MKPLAYVIPAAALALVCASQRPVPAQLPPPEEKPIVGPRMPALSPDGKRIAFTWRGDIWTADSSGGRAYPITSHVDLDAYPVFSPDGRWVAFSSTRSGNWDVYIVPATGGEARQLTFASTAEFPTDWSPDGKDLIFSAQYDKPYTTLFTLDVNTLRFHKITDDWEPINVAGYSPDGARLCFIRYGFPWTRPRYHGSAAAQLWTMDLSSGQRTAVADDEHQHLWPRFTADGKNLVTVTYGEETPNAQWLNKPLPALQDSPARTPNLWLFPLSGSSPRQLTRFTGGSVRYPVVARQSGDIAFEWDKDLYLLKKGGKEPQKLVFYAGADYKTNVVQREVLTSGVDEAEISKDGKTFAFGLRGDIWTIPVDKPKRRGADDAVRLTDYPGFDRDFNWSRDGKTLYFISDRDGNDRVYALDIDSKAVKAIWTGNEDASAPRLSPDGKWLGFWVAGPVGETSRAGFYVKPTAADQQEVAPKRLLVLPTAAQGSLEWSPDMKWIAYTRRGVESDGVNLWIAPADGSSPGQNVTRLNARTFAPAWSPDGRYLFFASDRSGAGLYVLPLKPEDAPTDELEMKFQKPTGPVSVEIDFTDTPQRIRKLNSQLPVELTVTAEGQLFFVSEGDAWTGSFDGKEIRRVTGGGGVSNLRASDDGRSLYYYKGGGLFVTKMFPGNPTSQVTFNATLEQDVRAVRKAAFTQFWREYHRHFYDANFHGRNWTAIRERYEPMLDGVGTREEFATLLNMVIGEVEASHSEVNPAPGGTPGPTTSSLGLYFDYAYEGPGIRVLDVPKRAPGSYEKTRVKPGEYIVAIDGKDVTLDEGLFKLLNDKGDRDWELLVNSEPKRDGARTVRYKAMSLSEWTDIHYRNKIDKARRLVDEKSGGKLAYVHIAGMGGENQVQFDRELYEYADGKDGVVIDVRNNGGGNIADSLLNWLGTKPYGYYQPRDGYLEPAPGRGWKKPIVVLMNENSYSNAEMFPYDMRAAGLAKLVGMPTPGYVIWTGGLTLVDGTRARMPGMGVYRLDGSPLENMGEQPDVKIPFTRDDWAADRDPQLEKAVELLIKK